MMALMEAPSAAALRALDQIDEELGFGGTAPATGLKSPAAAPKSKAGASAASDRSNAEQTPPAPPPLDESRILAIMEETRQVAGLLSGIFEHHPADTHHGKPVPVSPASVSSAPMALPPGFPGTPTATDPPHKDPGEDISPAEAPRRSHSPEIGSLPLVQVESGNHGADIGLSGDHETSGENTGVAPRQPDDRYQDSRTGDTIDAAKPVAEPAGAEAGPLPGKPFTAAPERDGQAKYSGLDRSHAELLARLAIQREWPRSAYEEIARACRLMPDGALEIINEWSFEKFDEPLIEDGDVLTIELPLLT